MLEKGMVEIFQDRVHAFYMQPVSGVEALGGWRSVTDISLLKIFIALSKFIMEMVVSVLASIWKGDIMFLWDL